MSARGRAFFFLLFLLAFLSGREPRGSAVLACFAVVAGREATEDGSVLVGHNEQDNGPRILDFSCVPAMSFEPGAKVALLRGGAIEQVPKTAAYLWSQCPREEFADNFLNEHGVCVVSDRCPSREDDYDALVARGEIRLGGIGLMLRRLVAQRARAAREGVELAGELIERFGYVDSGRTYVIADVREAWLLAVVRGRRWVAQRVPDDAVTILPNVYVIGQVDLGDRENFLGSPDLVDYAVRRGWYDPASGKPFDFQRAYRAQRPDELDPRRWTAYCLLTSREVSWPAREEIPFAVRLPRKLSVADVAEVLRSRGGAGPRPISSDNTLVTNLFQLRRAMPRPIGCVWWRIMGEPSCGVMTPWYLGITEVPAAYCRDEDLAARQTFDSHFHPLEGVFEPDPTKAWWRLKLLADWVHADYPRRINVVRPVWSTMERKTLAEQPAFEAEILRLWERDPAAARDRLTRYCAERAEEVCRQADRLQAAGDDPSADDAHHSARSVARSAMGAAT